MIVGAAPRLSQVVREVWQPLLSLFVWDMGVTIFYWYSPFKAPQLPLPLFGTVLALFLGARGSSAYQRWWEGRTLWGAMINSSRALARATLAFLDGSDPMRVDLRRSIVLRQVAYVHTLRCRLRNQPASQQARRYLSAGEADEFASRVNPANGVLDGTALRIAHAQRSGLIDTVQQSALERVLIDITNAQGGMERLRNTPLPNQYRFFPALFTRLFCALLPVGLVETLGLATPVGSTVASLMFLAALAIGDDLVNPFANTVHDVPMSALCRTIEIDLLQSLGDQGPEPIKLKQGALW